jgi:hypothetical protein
MENTMPALTRISFDDTCPFEHLGNKISTASLSAHDKEWLGAQLYYCKISSVKLSQQYGISEGTLRAYKAKVVKGEYFRNESGRPPLLDEIAKEEIKIDLSGKQYQKTLEEFPLLIQEKAVETAVRRGETCTIHINPSPRSCTKYRKILKLMKTAAEQATAARLQACSCFRNLFTMITANSIMASITPRQLILNMDATQFHVGGNCIKKVDVLIPKGSKNSNLKCKPKKNMNAGISAYFIKYYLILTADGKAAPAIFLLADDKMNVDALDVHKVVGVGHSNCPESNYCYIVFTKTRAGNEKFYSWLIEIMLISFVQSTRQYLPDDYKNHQAWFQLDGEWSQIKVFLESNILQQMQDNNIVVGKFPGSTTEIFQPADQNPFKACKTILKGINDCDVKDMTFEITTIKKVITQHEANCSTVIRPIQKGFIVKGILRISLALQNGICGTTLRNSFKDTGIYPFNMDKMIANCKAAVPDIERFHWGNQLHAAKQLMLEHGELSDQLLDQLNICNNMKTNKDHLIIPRRRMIFITNPSFVDLEAQKMEVKKKKDEDKQRKRSATTPEKASKKVRKEAPSLSPPQRKPSLPRSTSDVIEESDPMQSPSDLIQDLDPMTVEMSEIRDTEWL